MVNQIFYLFFGGTLRASEMPTGHGQHVDLMMPEGHLEVLPRLWGDR